MISEPFCRSVIQYATARHLEHGFLFHCSQQEWKSWCFVWPAEVGLFIGRHDTQHNDTQAKWYSAWSTWNLCHNHAIKPNVVLVSVAILASLLIVIVLSVIMLRVKAFVHLCIWCQKLVHFLVKTGLLSLTSPTSLKFGGLVWLVSHL